MKNKIPVCDKCGKICKVGEHKEFETGSYFTSEFLSDCCRGWITYYDNIKEVILLNLE